MKKQMITESDLKARIAALEAKMAMAEDAASIGQALGQVGGGAAGVAAAVPRAGAEVAQGIANNAGKWWDAAKQGVSNFAGGVAKGAQQGWAATDPAKLVGGGQQAAAARPGTTAPKADPAVMKLQQELIAKGAKIKADGVMGPATKAAQAQFGGAPAAAPAGTPAAATSVDAAKAAGAAMNAPAAPAAAVPGQMAGGQVVDTRGGIGGQEEMEESVTFRNEDSLARIMQIATHRR